MTLSTAPASSSVADEPRRSLLRRHRDFRLLFVGEVAGKYGSSVTGLALPLIAVTRLHAGALAVSALPAATWLPWLLVGL